MTAPFPLCFEAVCKAFEAGRPVLDGVDLQLAPGTLTVLEGRSGSGKTTLLNLALGWDRPDAGKVSVAGRDPATDPPPWLEVAVAPQAPGLLPELTVAENVWLPARLAGRGADPAAACALLGALGLDPFAGRPAERTSLGQQQRAALARALVLQPAVLLADEPLAHQDRAHAGLVVAAIRRACDAGGAALVASHDPQAHRGADTVLALVDGRLQAI